VVDSSVQMFGVVAGVVGSVALVAQVLAQLTAGVRLRRLASTLLEASGGPLEPSQVAVVSSVFQSTVGRIVAREAVPPRKFVIASLVALGAIWGNFVTGRSSVGPDASAYITWSNVGVYAIALTTCLRTLVYYSLERRRIAGGFAAQQSPLVSFAAFRTARRFEVQPAQWLYCALPAYAASTTAFLFGLLSNDAGRVSDEAASLTACAFMLTLAAAAFLAYKISVADAAADLPLTVKDRAAWAHPAQRIVGA
jgi:hypothetical protein